MCHSHTSPRECAKNLAPEREQNGECIHNCFLALNVQKMGSTTAQEMKGVSVSFGKKEKIMTLGTLFHFQYATQERNTKCFWKKMSDTRMSLLCNLLK